MAEQTESTDVIRNCTECKKVITRARRYYRNGAYYCNKNCFKKKMAKDAAEAPAG